MLEVSVTSTVKQPTYLGNGVYSLPEAARLVGMTPQRLRTWFAGRKGRQDAFFQPDYEPRDGQLAISFRDMIDAFVAVQFRDRRWGASRPSLERLRRIYRNAQELLGTKHAFCHQEFHTDGRTLFMKLADAEGHSKLVDLFDRQLMLDKVILPFLKKLDYDPEVQLAYRWNIADGVVLDPQINFGKPVVRASGISTRVLAGAYEANNRNADIVANWWDVSAEDVLAAVQFERTLRGERAA
jgi:uncharacterized protein (DUF433 family)